MIKEKLMHAAFFIAACTSILAVALICLFLFANGIPAIQEIGVFKFLLGTRWKPGNNIFGILPMIMGSIYVTAGAIIIGVPIGIMTSIFMAEYCPRKIYGFLKSATELLAGIPLIRMYAIRNSSTTKVARAESITSKNNRNEPGCLR